MEDMWQNVTRTILLKEEIGYKTYEVYDKLRQYKPILVTVYSI